MMHPYLFEDPFITTGVSACGIHHEFPPDTMLDGGNLWDAALQARVAITDRVAFIATKDGFVNFRPGLGALEKDYGFTAAASSLPTSRRRRATRNSTAYEAPLTHRRDVLMQRAAVNVTVEFRD